MRVGLQSVGNLEPSRAQGAGLLLIKAACDTLTRFDLSGAVSPGLASSWDMAGEGKRLTLKLRRDLSFHDGETLDAPAVADSLSRVVQDAANSPWAALLSNVLGYSEVVAGSASRLQGIAVKGPHSLQIDLSQPDADFPASLAHPSLAPVSPRQPPAAGSGPLPICVGPFRFGGASGHLRLENLQSYQGPHPARLDRIHLSEFESEDAVFEAFLRDEVDVSPAPGARLLEIPQGAGHLRRATPQLTYLAVDITKPETADARVRRSLSLAINRLAVIDGAFGDDRRPAFGWLGVDPPSESECNRFGGKVADVDRARSLFAESGIQAEAVKLPLRFDGSQFGRLVGEAVAVEISSALGVKVTPEAVDQSTLQATVRDKATPFLALMTADPDVPVPGRLIANLFSTGSPSNMLGYSSDAFDRKLQESRSTLEQDDRLRAFADAESLLCSAMPAIPLWTGARHWVLDDQRARVEGSELDFSGDLPLRDLREPQAIQR